MDSSMLRQHLADLPLGAVAYYSVLESTNTEAMRWAEEGAPHLSLIAADQQTAGRGRMDRSWYTLPGAALAFSLVIRPEQNQFFSVSWLTGLGALSVCDVLQNKYKLPAEIKWPNDVLVAGRKLAGVLVDAQWQGDEIQSAVLGIGINVARRSVPSQGELNFPATSVATVFGRFVDRWVLLKEVLAAMLARLQQSDQDDLIEAWEANLAFRGEVVQILKPGDSPESGRIEGLSAAGYLRLRLPSGEEKLIRSGDVNLRQVDRT